MCLLTRWWRRARLTDICARLTDICIRGRRDACGRCMLPMTRWFAQFAVSVANPARWALRSLYSGRQRVIPFGMIQSRSGTRFFWWWWARVVKIEYFEGVVVFGWHLRSRSYCAIHVIARSYLGYFFSFFSKLLCSRYEATWK